MSSGFLERSGWREKIKAHVVTSEDVDKIEGVVALYLQFIFASCSFIWVAPPGWGKTTVARWLACRLAELGLEVYYFQLDTAAAQIKEQYKEAEAHGYQLITPLKDGQSDETAKEALEELMSSPDLDDVAVIADTLPKFTDVGNKSALKKFAQSVRHATRHGCTFLGLAHARKYKEEDGSIVYDGVGDVQANFDHMTYIYADFSQPVIKIRTDSDPANGAKNRYGIQDLEFALDKHSGEFRLIGDARSREELDEERQTLADEPFIAAVKKHLNREINLGTLEKILKRQESVPLRETRSKIGRYSGVYWDERRGANNARIFSPLGGVRSVNTVKTEGVYGSTGV